MRDQSFAPRHPWMAGNGRSNLHDDAYQSDAGATPGPLGRDPEVLSNFFAEECASHTFDREGRLLTVCVGLEEVTLRLLDPRTLDVLARSRCRRGSPRRRRSRPSVVAATSTSTTGTGSWCRPPPAPSRSSGPPAGDEAPVLEPVRTYDVSATVGDGLILSALPDWDGRIWLVTDEGVVGTRRPPQRPGPLARRPRRHRQLDRRRRDRRRVRGVDQEALPVRRGPAWPSGRDLAAAVRRGRPAEARPEPGRVGHHADDHQAPREAVRRDHRQRRPADARRGPPRRAGPVPGVVRCAGSRSSPRTVAPPTTP